MPDEVSNCTNIHLATSSAALGDSYPIWLKGKPSTAFVDSLLHKNGFAVLSNSPILSDLRRTAQTEDIPFRVSDPNASQSPGMGLGRLDDLSAQATQPVNQ